MLDQLPTWSCRCWEFWETFLVVTRRRSNASESHCFRIPLPETCQKLPLMYVYTVCLIWTSHDSGERP